MAKLQSQGCLTYGLLEKSLAYIGRYVEGVPESRGSSGCVGEVVNLEPSEPSASAKLDRVHQVPLVHRPGREDAPRTWGSFIQGRS